MRISLLGGIDILSPEDRPVRFTTRKTALLFAALVLAGRKGMSRETLAEAFWPGRGEPQARNSLRQALVDIRRVFPAANAAEIHIEADMDNVALMAGPDEADVWVFDRKSAAAEIAELAMAADLYKGELLGNEQFEDAGELFGPHRSGYHRKALALVERLGIASPPAGSREEAACEGLAERLLAAEPTAEEAHRALIRIYRNRGKPNMALRQFLLCKEALRRDLDAEPEPATQALLADRPGGEPTAAAPEPPRAAFQAEVGKADVAVPKRRRDQPSVVVMPFDNLSSADDSYFVDGVVEEITAALSRVRDFFVVARQSAFVYKGRFVDVREIGAELGVAYVVEGTVRRGGDRLRISVHLVDAQSGSQLWSDRYEGDTSELFAFQDRIAAQVAGAIHPAVRLAEIEAARSAPPADLRAYDLVMRAFPKLWGQNSEAVSEAMVTLREAIALDPKYGRAHALLAWCHAVNATYLWRTDPQVELAAAVAAAEQASGLIDKDPTALTACGSAVSLAGDQEKATTLIGAALALDPNNAWAWTRFGWVAIYLNQAEDARMRFERAMALSPLDPFAFNMRIGLGTSLALEGRWKEAADIARDIVARNPNVTWAYRQLAGWAANGGDMATARWAARKLLESHADYTIARYRSLPLFRNIPDFLEETAIGQKLAGIPEG